MATTRNADAIDSVRINAGMGLGVANGVQDICDDEFRAAGFRTVVWTSEIRMDESPVFGYTPLGVANLTSSLTVVTRPRVQGH